MEIDTKPTVVIYKINYLVVRFEVKVEEVREYTSIRIKFINIKCNNRKWDWARWAIWDR